MAAITVDISHLLGRTSRLSYELLFSRKEQSPLAPHLRVARQPQPTSQQKVCMVASYYNYQNALPASFQCKFISANCSTGNKNLNKKDNLRNIVVVVINDTIRQTRLVPAISIEAMQK